MPEADKKQPGPARNAIRVSDPAVKALLPRYLERRRADVARIKGLLADERFAEVRTLAHNMRGSGTAYGVDFVTATGRTIEHAARDGDARIITDALDELSRFLDETVVE